MLHNTCYIGKKVLVGRKLSDKEQKKLEEGTKIRFFNPEVDIVETPAILSPELFNKVQAAMNERRTRSYAKEDKKLTLLKGLVICER